MPMGNQARRRRGGRPLHSIHGILRRRDFVGSFELGRGRYNFSYSPASAEIVDGKLQLRGRLAIKGPRGQAGSRDKVRATLAGIQGATSGSAPLRPSKILDSNPPDESARALGAKLAATEHTGASSFVGVMYLRFEPLDGNALRVPADLSRVQLNARLYPIDDTARTLHGVYSFIVDSLHGDNPSSRIAEELVKELSSLLSS